MLSQLLVFLFGHSKLQLKISDLPCLIISNGLTCPPLILHQLNLLVNALLLYDELVFVSQRILEFGHLLL